MGSGVLKEVARQMRRESTWWEDAFWQVVRGRKVNGVKFRRQQVIQRFIVDFFAPSHKLVVEIDGEIHSSQKERDFEREQYLKCCGLKVLRFSNYDIEHHLDHVIEKLKEQLSSPSPQAGEGGGGEVR